MANPKIKNALLKSGSRTSLDSNFANQAWSNVNDYYGGYGGWSAGSGYTPRINYNSNSKKTSTFQKISYVFFKIKNSLCQF